MGRFIDNENHSCDNIVRFTDENVVRCFLRMSRVNKEGAEKGKERQVLFICKKKKNSYTPTHRQIEGKGDKVV